LILPETVVAEEIFLELMHLLEEMKHLLMMLEEKKEELI
jgi:hypothetical protein